MRCTVNGAPQNVDSQSNDLGAFLIRGYNFSDKKSVFLSRERHRHTFATLKLSHKTKKLPIGSFYCFL